MAPPLIGAPAASPAHVVVVADARSKLVDDAVAALVKDGNDVELRVLPATGAGDGALAVVDGAVLLAAGPKSARALAASMTATSSTSPRAALLVKSGDVASGLATVTLDAPLGSQLAWLRAAFPGRTRVIVPRARVDGSDALDAALVEAAKAAGLSLVLVDVRSAGECVPAVDEALKRGGPAVILVVPDPVAVTPDTVAPLVQDALAARAPVVGFSSYFLKLGALAAVAVDAGAMARQALALALSSATSTPAAATKAVAPSSGHLVVDGRLAERLGIAVKDGPGVEVRR